MIHLPFADRTEAGRLLAARLALHTGLYNQPRDAVVLGLARGGVPVAHAVADRLQLPLDVVVARKLGVPWQPELAMGALCGGARVLDYALIEELGIFSEDVEKIVAAEQMEMVRREQAYRGGKAPERLAGIVAILIDDGLATGNTMRAAIRCIRSQKPARVIAGVPVGSRTACDSVRNEADELVCLAIPEHFCAVGEWYREFPQVTDAEVKHLLTESVIRTGKKTATMTA